MNLITLRCPRCGNLNLRLLPRQKHVQCPDCRSKFAAQWPEEGSPRLSAFGAIVRQPMTEAEYLAADRRLALIGSDIGPAQEVAGLRHTELEETTAWLSGLEDGYQARIAGIKARFRLAVAAAGVSWCLVALVLENMAWYAGLAVALAATGSALWLRTRQRQAAEEMATRLSAGQPEVDEARALLNEAEAHLADLLLEKELCVLRVRRHRYLDEEADLTGALSA